MAFNNNAKPKVRTEHFKIYVDVGNAGLTPTWELQGRGVESWSVEQNQSIEKTTDVLGNVDMSRGTPQPVQSGIQLALRKGSKLAEMLFDAWFSGDFSTLDSVKILQKFEMVDGAETGTCKARVQDECLIDIKTFSGEAGDYLRFEVDFNYSNIITTGTMPIKDGNPITFTPDGESEEETDDTDDTDDTDGV